MSKVKNNMVLEQEKEFELELSYQEYLQEKSCEVNGIELIEKAREISPIQV